MKLSHYFQIIKPEYIYLRLTPNNSIRNYNSDKIAKAIQSMHKTLTQRIKKHEKKIFFEAPSKVSYYIYIEKTRIEFYFIFPKLYLSLLQEKIRDTWKGITIARVDSLPLFSDNAVKYQLTYSKEDAMSLAVDRRTNTLLSSSLNVIEVMEEGDKVGIFYNFIPATQLPWRAEYDRTMEKAKKNQPIDREKLSIKYAVKMLVVLTIELSKMITEILADLFATKVENNNPSILEMALANLNKKGWTTATQGKRDKLIIDTQIMVLSDSQDTHRRKNNVIAVCESFKSITEDNELIYKPIRIKRAINPLELRLSGTDTIKTSVDECQNFLALPGRELLEQYNCIDKIDTFESEVPEELQKGVMCIGDNTCKGKITKAYLTTDREFKNLTLVIIGPTRAGKTTLISNLAKDGIDHKETTIIFDYCGNCELSEEVTASIGKALIIDCKDFDKMQGLGYNEVAPINNDPLEIYRCAKTKTSQLMALVNSIAGEDLRDRMERYLEAAAVVVFLQDGPIRDVFAVLQDFKVRSQYTKNSPAKQKENLEEYILALEELDEWSRGTKDNPPEIIGTKSSFVQGILNRVHKLKQNTYMELMLKKDCKNNINLIEEMQKSQLICFKIPEIMFSTEAEKDIYATYWLTKIWGALQKRKWDIPKTEDRVKVNLVIDELYQVPSCQEFLRSKLSQIAKFNCKPVISCHYLGQIGIIRDELKAANSSYMLISGCDKDNFKELKSELYPYQEEDLLNLKRYHSLNLIKYEKGFAKFISKLPLPI